MIYLDYNATTPLHPAVKNSIINSVDLFGNPSSLHRYGIESKEVIDKARNAVATLVQCKPEEIVFTSGGTESNNISIIGFASQFRKGHIISSAIEHPSVLAPLERLKQSGFEITLIPCHDNGAIDPDEVANAVRNDTILITVMHANNETGVIQPIKEISAIARKRGITFHTDAAQTVGKIEVDVNGLGVNMLSIAAHKYYGPKGIGALIIRNGTTVNPIMYGASQEKGISPGTENIIGIAGLGTASERAADEIDDRVRQTREMRNLLLFGLYENIKNLRVNGDTALCLPNTLNISVKGISANTLVLVLKDSIAISAGSACHAGKHDPSRVLSAMGVNDQDALSSIRLSVGKFTTYDDINEAIKILSSAITKLRIR